MTRKRQNVIRSCVFKGLIFKSKGNGILGLEYIINILENISDIEELIISNGGLKIMDLWDNGFPLQAQGCVNEEYSN